MTSSETTFNDEELDALVKRLKFSSAILVAQNLDNRDIDDAARAITTLRAQLAEADELIEAQAKDHASNNIRLAETSYRADRAELRVATLEHEV